MRIAVVGGGPGGLCLAVWARRLDPAGEVTVWERNQVGGTFGFGVVFSAGALRDLEETDPVLYDGVVAESARWTDIAVHYRGEAVRSGGHGFAAVSRKALLRLLHRRCARAGVHLRFGEQAPPLERLAVEYDLVVAADGANSGVRSGLSEAFGTTLDTRSSRYIWLAVDRPFDALTFLIAETGHGVLHGHAYPFSAERSTFIVEAGERVWRASGFGASTAGPTADGSDRSAVERLGEVFAGDLDGHRLTGNRSRWQRFTVVRNRRWWQRNLALVGDAAHTTHFSVGSGTKLAMEDALALADSLREHDCFGDGPLEAALADYERRRAPAVAAAQRAAQVSLEWFEDIDRAVGRDAPGFAFELLTRGGRLSRSDLTFAVRPPETDFQGEII
ncbi:FAD-dependent monooxygenase [Kitasatospora sp. NPDC002040]|uniref:FAD-dependent monooxygenase n=1 Tax=Kitasatospora sp. NPDC002040 TaxID=3154661 RepID=UPI003317D9F3